MGRERNQFLHLPITIFILHSSKLVILYLGPCSKKLFHLAIFFVNRCVELALHGSKLPKRLHSFGHNTPLQKTKIVKCKEFYITRPPTVLPYYDMILKINSRLTIDYWWGLFQDQFSKLIIHTQKVVFQVI